MKAGELIFAQKVELSKKKVELMAMSNFVYTPEMKEIDKKIEALKDECEHKSSIGEFCINSNGYCEFCGKKI